VEAIKVIVADDHTLFREGLSELLSTEKDIECVAMAADGEEAVRLVKELHPDVALLDIAMPKLDGIEATRQIQTCRPETNVLIVSAYKYEYYVMACMEAGVSGYLLKNTPREDMVNAIRMVYSGKMIFSREAADDVLRRLISDKSKRRKNLNGLHKRELEIVNLAARGLGNKEIAFKLSISEHTVATHFANIFRKLGVESRTEATIHAFREGWLDVDKLE